MANGMDLALMQIVNDVSLVEVQHATDREQAKSEVLLSGSSTGIIIPGKILEAAVRVTDNRYVLFVTDDVLYEESLTIVLIDSSLGIQEIVTIGNECNSGTFEQLHISDHSLQFRFIGDYIWGLTLEDSPKFQLPFFSDPKGVSRSKAFTRFMNITALPA
ncbi:hypothetical protein [Pantoea sp. ICBG 985]|uniref:hypothetical protein n=1 Tax=Pantoea sp. ICBG 985 TaxID=2071683 RepID=UPI001E5EA155|nr:hypothetical protein [Pantoea sp. ICBG 985]